MIRRELYGSEAQPVVSKNNIQLIDVSKSMLPFCFQNYPFENEKVMKFFENGGFIGNDGLTTELETLLPYMIKVDPKINYEISFWMKITQNETGMFPLKLSVSTYSNFNIKTKTFDAKTNLGLSVMSNYNVATSIPNNAWRFYRFIIFKHNNTNIPYHKTSMNLNQFKNLKFGSKTRKMIVNFENLLGTEFELFNLVIKPISLPFNSCFLNNSNFAAIARKNRNNNKTNKEVNDIAKDYLLPYNLSTGIIEL